MLPNVADGAGAGFVSGKMIGTSERVLLRPAGSPVCRARWWAHRRRALPGQIVCARCRCDRRRIRCVSPLFPTSYLLFPISYFLPPTSYFPFPTSYFLPPISYLLFPISYLLFPISYFLSPISYLLFPISYFLSPISYLLFPISYFLPPHLASRKLVWYTARVPPPPWGGWRRKGAVTCLIRTLLPRVVAVFHGMIDEVDDCFTA